MEQNEISKFNTARFYACICYPYFRSLIVKIQPSDIKFDGDINKLTTSEIFNLIVHEILHIVEKNKITYIMTNEEYENGAE